MSDTVMKCQYCGYNVGIEEEKCPYCGKENHFANPYVEELLEADMKLEETKTEVKGKKKRTEYLGRCVIIFVLIIILSILNTINDNLWNLSERMNTTDEKMRALAIENQDMHMKKLDEFIVNKDYLGFDYYCQDNHLYSQDFLRGYHTVKQATICYRCIYIDILILLEETDYIPVSIGESKEEVCLDMGHYTSGLAEYTEINSKYADEIKSTGIQAEYLASIKQDAGDFIQVYFQLTDKEVEQLWMLDDESAGQFLLQKYQESGGLN